jgi:guanylate kinase
MSAGKLIVITGPSGVGKGTIVRSLIARHPELYLSISTTTRKPRPDEINGKDYYFVSKQQFEIELERGELLEWAEYAGNYYGTPKNSVEIQLNRGKWVLLEIELIGARKVKQIFSNALLIFILPPSLKELKRRLIERGKDSPEAISRRLERAKAEIEAKDEFNIQIVNDDLETAIAEIEKAIFGNEFSLTSNS